MRFGSTLIIELAKQLLALSGSLELHSIGVPESVEEEVQYNDETPLEPF
jgi:hypothetical protein